MEIRNIRVPDAVGLMNMNTGEFAMSITADDPKVTSITSGQAKTDEEKREQLRAKIEAAEKRNDQRSIAEQAKEAADTAVEFAKRHPLLTVGGAIAAGLAIGAMTRRGRRLGRRGGAFATLATEAALAYGARMLDRATDAAEFAGDRFEDMGDSAATAARGLRRDASYRLDRATDALRSTKRKAGRKGSRSIRNLRTLLTH